MERYKSLKGKKFFTFFFVTSKLFPSTLIPSKYNNYFLYNRSYSLPVSLFLTICEYILYLLNKNNNNVIVMVVIGPLVTIEKNKI